MLFFTGSCQKKGLGFICTLDRIEKMRSIDAAGRVSIHLVFDIKARV
jgi:hypothetical protein